MDLALADEKLMTIGWLVVEELQELIKHYPELSRLIKIQRILGYHSHGS